MARYSRITDDEADDDSVALMLGQVPPRLSRFGATEYVQLDNLDEDGNAEEDSRKNRVHERFRTSRKSSHNLLVIVFGAAFSLVLVGVVISVFRRHHAPAGGPRKMVLAEPLNSETKFSNGTHQFKRTTLLISLDGMHPHYLSSDRTPRLHNLTQSGFSTPYIKPSFPTQTFPNHWTLVTGMYPANHGIVGNTFMDPELKLEFVNTDPTKSLDRRFWGGEPIWMTARRHGLKTAVHMWPGSEAEWGVDAPDEVDKFNADEPLGSKRDTIMKWLDREEPPQLMLSYVPTVDSVGHKVGIDGPDLLGAFLEVDRFIGEVMDGIAQRNLTDIVNLVVVSDHGMSPTSNDRLVFLDDIVSNYEDATSNRGWPLAGLRFNTTEEVDDAFASAKEHEGDSSTPGFKAYKSDDMPERWHFGRYVVPGSSEDSGVYKHHGQYEHRLAPLYIVPEPGYSLLTHEDWDKMGHEYFLKGVHGYDNESPMMRALFLAHGPAFPPGKYAPFDNVEVYSAICRSLGFPESIESDGDFRGLKLSPKKLANALGNENYPGLEHDIPTFKGSSFDDCYQSTD